jgi:hypothetical protein
VTQSNDKSSIRQFPAVSSNENLSPSDVKNAGISVKELDARLEQVLQRKAVWSKGVL